MPNRIAKFSSALLASFLAGAALAVVSNTTTRAADNCLRAPGEETPQGRHWYYRIDRATQRHCWYLGEEKDRPARAAVQDPAPPADADATSKTKPTQRSVADARAELPWPAPRIEQGTGAPALSAVPNIAANGNIEPTATTDVDRQASLVASRWPGTPDATVSTNPAPTTVASVIAPTNATAPPPPAAPTVILAAADVPSGKTSDSIPMLLTIAAGALSVAGVMGSAIFRLGSKRRKRRREIWGDRRAPRDLADRAPPPVYRHPREFNERMHSRRGPRRPDERDDRPVDFYAEKSRRART